ncbi:ATP-binding protein, partial [Nostoc sp. NIES-2111]
MLLQEMVMVRAFPDLNWQDRHQLITEVFDSPSTLKRLCKASGGHIRNLIMLLYRCIQRQDPPLSLECVERVIRQRCNELTLAITPDEWVLLNQVAQNKTIRGEEAYQMLIHS